jgi:apolipoprotein N-acyltransferase
MMTPPTFGAIVMAPLLPIGGLVGAALGLVFVTAQTASLLHLHHHLWGRVWACAVCPVPSGPVDDG